MYIRLFDVDWDEIKGTALPVGKIHFQTKIPGFIHVTPVVYLTTKTLQKTSDSLIINLANKIFKQVESTTSSNNIHYDELQIDCDWTESTRVKYFALLNTLKKLELSQNVILSSTIRLHQIKYPIATGIPPVNRGMLMFYNMGSLAASAQRNSIYNEYDAGKYAGYIHKYPLKLDIALPLFSWSKHTRNGHIIELISKLPISDYNNNLNFTKTDSIIYIATNSFFYRGFYFMKDDKIIIEQMQALQCKTAALQVDKELQKTQRSIVFFHFDSLTLSQYAKQDLEEIFNIFN